MVSTESDPLPASPFQGEGVKLAVVVADMAMAVGLDGQFSILRSAFWRATPFPASPFRGEAGEWVGRGVRASELEGGELLPLKGGGSGRGSCPFAGGQD